MVVGWAQWSELRGGCLCLRVVSAVHLASVCSSVVSKGDHIFLNSLERTKSQLSKVFVGLYMKMAKR